MKQVDYIIVGCGLAGIAFCEQLIAHNKSFVVFDNASQQASTVAGGMYNPVVLKRFTSVWKSKKQLELAKPLYNSLEQKLRLKLDYQTPVYRRFTSVEEQNNWLVASDKPELAAFLAPELIKNTNPKINAPFGFGKVLNTGRIDTANLIIKYKTYLKDLTVFFEEKFNYSVLQFNTKTITYKTIKAKHIVFAEGFGVKHNPFFKMAPLKVAKGELLTLKIPDLQLNYILKAGIFCIPLGNNLYRIGSTYNWEDTTPDITEKAKTELLLKLNNLIPHCKYEIIKQSTGIRPTVIDRRPLIGKHPIHKNMHILNGLGTRGVMIAPYVAKQLITHIEQECPLDPEINYARFNK